MEFSDWLLALHLLSAFALVAALVLFTAVMVANWGDGRPQRASASVSYTHLTLPTN